MLIDQQIGLERTIGEYVDRVVGVMREVKRILKPDGVLWLNLGDCYSVGGRKATGRNDATRRDHREDFGEGERVEVHADGERTEIEVDYGGLRPGNLLGLAWRIAFAMQADGWILRQWCPWIKRNAMPESVKSRPASACEIVFMFTKSEKYFYDFQAVEQLATTLPKANGRYSFGAAGGKFAQTPGSRHRQSGQPWRPRKNLQSQVTRRLRNSDWFFKSWQGLETDEDGNPLAFVVNTKPLKELHFAPFPIRLVEPCLLSCSRPGDIVIDPFAGSGTVGLAAVRHSRKAILIDLNEKYMEIAKRRVGEELRACERPGESAAFGLKNPITQANGPDAIVMPESADKCGPPSARRSDTIQGGPEDPEKHVTQNGDWTSVPTGPLINTNCLNGILHALKFGAPDLSHHVEAVLRGEPLKVGTAKGQEKDVCGHLIEMHLDDATAILVALVRIEREHGQHRRFHDQQISFLVCIWRERVDQLRCCLG